MDTQSLTRRLTGRRNGRPEGTKNAEHVENANGGEFDGGRVAVAGGRATGVGDQITGVGDHAITDGDGVTGIGDRAAATARAANHTPARALTIGAGGVVLAWGGNQLGWWWVTILTGIGAALLLRGRAVAWFVLAVPLVSWGGDLFRRWTEMDTTRISRVTIGLAGIGDDAAWLGYVLTVLYAVLLCAAGAWLTAAVRQVVSATQEVRRGGEPVPTSSEVHTEQEERVADV